MAASFVLFYYAASFIGTTAYCLFWIEFSVPAMNAAWLIGVPVAGTAVEILRLRKDLPSANPRLRIAHAWVCGLVAIYSVAWPGALMLLTRNFPPRPDYAFLVCLAPLAPYLPATPAAMSEWWNRSPSRWCLEGAAAILVLIPSAADLAINALGTFLLSGHHGTCDVKGSPDRACVVHTEVRSFMLWSRGEIWLESKRFPIRRLVHAYDFDNLPPTITWDRLNRLVITGPGQKLGRPILY